MSRKNHIYTQRCFDLARLGAGQVSPNPNVGAVISSGEKVVGEGYHKTFGKDHAEVRAVKDAIQNGVENFEDLTIHVSLEPCNIHGNTPPCTQLIIDKKIGNVVISTIDLTKGVNFTGIKRLKQHGHTVQHGELQSKGAFLVRVRNTFVSRKRPYIILKYAKSQDGFITKDEQQIWLSNAYTKRLVHKWRTEIRAIIVGTNTALIDNPQLTSRLYPGTSPLRISIDNTLQIPPNSHLLDGKFPTWIYTTSDKALSKKLDQNLVYKPVRDRSQILQQICSELHQDNRDTLMVEGGPTLLNSFIQAGLWDEARVITSSKNLQSGLQAPQLEGHKVGQFYLENDEISLILSPNNVIYS